MKNAPFITDDTIVFGLLMLLLAFVFYTSSQKEGFWKKFYVIFPSLLMCYLLPSIFSSLNIISPEWTEIGEADPMQFYNAWLLNEYKERNPMNLNANKLIDLLEIDLTKFKNAIAKNNAIANIVEPIEEDFRVYAETDEELARLKLSTDLVEVIQRTKKICGFVNLSSLKPIIIYDGATNEYAVNNEFVKSKFSKNVL